MIVDFLNECCALEPSESIPVTDLYQAYRVWSDNNKTQPKGKNIFNQKMREKGYRKYRGINSELYWRGVRLLSENEKNERLTNRCLTVPAVTENKFMTRAAEIAQVLPLWIAKGKPKIVYAGGDIQDLEKLLANPINEALIAVVLDWFYSNQPIEAVWKSQAGDIPVKINGVAGSQNCMNYYKIEDSKTAIPEGELEFKSVAIE